MAIRPGSGLATDLYEITMMAGYYARPPVDWATFDLYVRSLPPGRSFLVAAGLEQALDHLDSLSFTPEEIEYLRRLPNLRDVSPSFFDEHLTRFRFTGEVWAVPEGTPVFAQQPLLRISGPAPEAQLVETALLAIVAFQTSVASKAARVVHAAAGRPVVEFGARRAHGLEAALLAARAAVIGGCESTSNVEAGYRFDIPVSGTMAHSWVMAHGDEMEAFRRFSAIFGSNSILLIDTYDTLRAARQVAASELRPAAVRLDSGDLVALSRQVRDILDTAGRHQVKIFASGDLNEDRIAALLAAGAPIDGFGVGASISVALDAPSLGGVYKLVETGRDSGRTPAMKLSTDKISYPGSKQVWRVFADGRAMGDVIATSDEPGPPGGIPLLERVMVDGRRTASSPPLRLLRERCRAGLSALPPGVLRLHSPDAYPVAVSDRLERLARDLTALLGAREPRGSMGR